MGVQDAMVVHGNKLWMQILNAYHDPENEDLLLSEVADGILHDSFDKACVLLAIDAVDEVWDKSFDLIGVYFL